MASLVRLSPPGAMAVSLHELKAHVRYFEPDEDALLVAYARSAQEWAETQIGRVFMTSEFAWRVDAFPARYETLELPVGPLQSVGTISYLDTDGFVTLLSPLVYQVTGIGGGTGRVALAYNQSWPSVRPQPEAVVVTFTAGFGDTHNDIPEPLRQAVMLLVAHWFEVRAASAAGPDFGPVTRVPYGVEALIGPYRVLQAAAA